MPRKKGSKNKETEKKPSPILVGPEKGKRLVKVGPNTYEERSN